MTVLLASVEVTKLIYQKMFGLWILQTRAKNDIIAQCGLLASIAISACMLRSTRFLRQIKVQCELQLFSSIRSICSCQKFRYFILLVFKKQANPACNQKALILRCRSGHVMGGRVLDTC